MPAVPGQSLLDDKHVIQPSSWVPRIGSAVGAIGAGLGAGLTAREMKARYDATHAMPFSGFWPAAAYYAPKLVKLGRNIKSTWSQGRHALGYQPSSSYSRSTYKPAFKSYAKRSPYGMTLWGSTQWNRRGRGTQRRRSPCTYRRRRASYRRSKSYYY